MQGNTQHSDGTDGLGRRYNVGDPLRHHSIPATSVGMQSDGFLVPAIVVWLAVLVLWRGALSAGFVFDDIVRIVGEERFIVAPWTSWQAVAVGQRPLVQLSLGLNHALGGLNPWGYHAFNILVHATAAVAALLAVRCCLDSLRRRQVVALTPSASTFCAVAVALLWALHPLQTAVATYVIQRAEAMAGLFLFAAVACLCCGAQQRPASIGVVPRHRVADIWFTSTVVCCLLAIAAKPTAACSPALLLAIDAFILSGSLLATLRSRWLLHLVLWTTTCALIPLGVVRGVFSNAAGNAGAGLRVADTTPLEYAGTQVRAVGLYMGELVFPSLMSIDHGIEELTAPWILVVGVATVVLLAVLVVIAVTRRCWWGILPVFFIVSLAPSSSFVPLADVAADHRMYLPLIAVMAAVVSVAASLWIVAQRHSRRIGQWVGAVMIAALFAAIAAESVGTSLRNREYANPLLLWSQVIDRRPEHVRARINRAGILMQLGRDDDAQRDLDVAAALRPQNPLLQLYKAILYLRREQPAAALASLELATPSLRASASLHGATGDALRALGRPCDAAKSFRRAAALSPSGLHWKALEATCKQECCDAEAVNALGSEPATEAAK